MLAFDTPQITRTRYCRAVSCLGRVPTKCFLSWMSTRPSTPTSGRASSALSLSAGELNVINKQKNSAGAARGSYSALPFAGSTKPIAVPSQDEYAFSTSLRRQSVGEDHHVPFLGGSASNSHNASHHHHGYNHQQTAYDSHENGYGHSHNSNRGRSTSLHQHHPFAHTAGVTTPSARFARCTFIETASQLQTDLDTGLSSTLVPAIREIAGPNEFQVASQEKAWSKFAKQFYESPLILLLLGSSAVSALVGNYDDAASITIAIVIVVTGQSGPSVIIGIAY